MVFDSYFLNLNNKNKINSSAFLFDNSKLCLYAA